MRVPDIGNARAQARRVVREALRDRKAVLGAVTEDELSVELAAAYRDTYRWRARREACDRRIDTFMAGLYVVLGYGPLALLFLAVQDRVEPGAWAAAWYFGGWIAGCVAFFGFTLLMERLSARSQAFCSGSVIAGVLGGAYLLWREAGSVDALLDMITAATWRVALTGASAVPILTLAVLLPAVSLRSRLARRAQQPQAALLVELFALAHALTAPRALDHKAWLLRSLDRAADVLETRYWREVHLASPLSRATWRDRCRQCSQRLRSFDLWIVLPRRDTREHLLAEVIALIHVLVRGCLDELPTAEPSPHRKLAVLGNAVRNLLLGLIPLAAVFGARFAGLDLSGVLGGALVVAAIAWFALTVLTTLDGQAATRISLLKDAAEAMASFRGKP